MRGSVPDLRQSILVIEAKHAALSRRGAGPVLALAVLLLAGCGGSRHAATTTVVPPTAKATEHLAKPAYVARLRALGNRVGRAVDGLYPLDSGPPKSAFAATTIAKLERARAVVVTADRSLQQIVPPAAAASGHRQLVAAVGKLDVQIERLANSLRTGDTTTFDELDQLPALRALNAATNALAKRGFDVVG
jgi:hypothetical protein